MNSLLDPAILFFVLGVTAGAIKSNLEIPPPIAKFLSLYLLMSMGLKGGFALAGSGLDASVLRSLGAALAMAVVVPALGYAFLRRRVSPFDAAAVAASYGSVSAVTFVTASQFLEHQGLQPGGHMAAAMVLMESPAILMAVALATALRQARSAGVVMGGPAGAATLALGAPSHAPAHVPGAGPGLGWGGILKESFTEGAQVLLLGSLLIGYLSGEAGQAVMQPFSGALFKGMLALFLLDMGLLVARQFGTARRAAPVLVLYAVGAPWVHAALALLLAAGLGLSVPDATLLMVLSASASYIVVPAIVRHAIPEANPGLYFGLSLGLTFPMNILVGIPVYAAVAAWCLGAA